MTTPKPSRLHALWLKPARRAPMEAHDRFSLVEGKGIRGNANWKGRRQVTLLDLDAWDRVESELGTTVDPTARRANLLLRGIGLEETKGRILRVGACRIEIRGETKPCRRMDQAHDGLQVALVPEWRGGAYGVVLDSGEIQVGDEVEWVD